MEVAFLSIRRRNLLFLCDYENSEDEILQDFATETGCTFKPVFPVSSPVSVSTDTARFR